MSKNQNRLLTLVFCILVMGGCVDWRPAASSQPAGQAAAAVENAAPDLAVFEHNLIAEFDPLLDEAEDLTRYVITLRITDDLKTARGHQVVRYTNLESGGLNEIIFNLNPNTGGDYLVVDDVRVNGLPTESQTRFDNAALAVNLAEPLLPGESLLVSMDFSLRVPEEMGGNYGLFIFQEDILALDSFFPIIPVFDEAGWHAGYPPRNADMIFTDAAFFEVVVDAPETTVLVASGSAVEAFAQDGRQTITFAGGPQRDFYLAVSPRFQNASQMIGEVKVTSFYPSGFDASGKMVLDTAARALEVFSKRYGSYPYTELDVVSTPMNAGGMEYSGAIALALGLFSEGAAADGDIPPGSYLKYATAHEVAHQWFFNQVINDQLEEPWLDEGFAQYLTYIYFLDTYGNAAADQVLASWERNWSRADERDIPIGKPAQDYEPNDYTAIIYGRAPLFILELEKRMGEADFEAFLADYVAQYRWNTTDTAQFKALAEARCACDLTSLFKLWGAIN